MSNLFTLSSRSIKSNLLSVLIAFHCFCIQIALGDVNSCFSTILILLNKDKHTTKDDCEPNKSAQELRQLTGDTLPPTLVLHQELCTISALGLSGESFYMVDVWKEQYAYSSHERILVLNYPNTGMEEPFKWISQHSYIKCTSLYQKKHMEKCFYNIMLPHRTLCFW